MLLEEDTLYDYTSPWLKDCTHDSDRDRHAIKRRMTSLESAVGLLAAKLQMPELDDLLKQGKNEEESIVDAHASTEKHTAITTSTNGESPSWEVVMDSDSGPAAIPASVVSTIPPTRPPPLVPCGDRSNLDLIARGVVSLENAESLFTIYHGKLDHFLYRILVGHNSLTSVRASSPLLTAAVCTVSALHASTPEYDACYEDFVNLCAAQVFSKTHTVDDVRALCIGAFWLSGISWTLVGLGTSTIYLPIPIVRRR
jgi:hypothetical protein